MAAPEKPALLGLSSGRWSALGNLFQAVTALGVLFGVFEYVQSLEAGRAEKTLNLIDRWTEEGYRADFLSLRDRFVTVERSIPEADRQAVKESAELMDRMERNVAAAVLKTTEAQAEFDNVIYYFDLLGLCVEANLCSEHTAEVFFKETLQNFSNVFAPEITARRVAFPGFAEGIDILLDSFDASAG